MCVASTGPGFNHWCQEGGGERGGGVGNKDSRIQEEKEKNLNLKKFY
jgi:hypothetical protein